MTEQVERFIAYIDGAEEELTIRKNAIKNRVEAVTNQGEVRWYLPKRWVR